MNIPTALAFDDVLIRPKFSDVLSRDSVDLSTQFTENYRIQIPIVGAPMDTVVGCKMAFALRKLGAVGILHRFMSIEEQADCVGELRTSEEYSTSNNVIAAAIGSNGDALMRATALVEAGATVLCVDVAHGHQIHVKFLMKELQVLQQEYEFDIIAGSIATIDAAYDLIDWGANALRVGIGGGSICSTRIMTGCGIPTFESVLEICSSITGIPVIADGGIRTSGDIAKAIGAGASSCMLGSLLATTEEAPGEIFIEGMEPNTTRMKMYRGAASATTKLKYTGTAEHVEGVSKVVKISGTVDAMIDHLSDGLSSSMSYVGAHNIKEFQKKVKFVRITSSGLAEAHPHILR